MVRSQSRRVEAQAAQILGRRATEKKADAAATKTAVKTQARVLPTKGSASAQPHPAAGAEKSAKSWQAFRESQKDLPLEPPLNQWQAYRAGQKLAGSPQTVAEDRAYHEGGKGTGSKDGEDPGKAKVRRRRDDLGL